MPGMQKTSEPTFLGPLLEAEQALKSIFRILRKSSWPHDLSRLKLDGEECVVLGNGPSLAKDLECFPEYFHGKICFAVNNFPATSFFPIVKPSYFLLLDPDLWRNGSAPELIRQRENIFSGIRESCDWPMVVFIPNDVKRDIQPHFLEDMPNVTVAYFNSTPLWGPDWLRYPLYRAGLGMPHAYNVLVASIFLTLKMGYRRVTLFGADHSWHENIWVSPDNILSVRQVHFYDHDDSDATVTPIYMDPEQTRPFRIHEIFHRWAEIFFGYVEIRRFADSLGAEVLNMGSKSYLDAFNRRPFAPKKGEAD